MIIKLENKNDLFGLFNSDKRIDEMYDKINEIIDKVNEMEKQDT